MATTPKKTARPSFTTPKGTFKYPALTKPDFGNEEYPNPDGSFKVAVIIPMGPEVQALIDKLTPLWDVAVAEGAVEFAKLAMPVRKKLGALKEQMFYEEEYDVETELPTGNVIFKVKTKYKITDKKDKSVRFNKIGLFDSLGKPLPADTLIYGGTTGKVAFQTNPYFVAGQGMAGLSLRLTAAQVINLVGPGARNAEGYGFGAEEDGYVASDAVAAPADEAGEEPSASANGNPQDF